MDMRETTLVSSIEKLEYHVEAKTGDVHRILLSHLLPCLNYYNEVLKEYDIELFSARSVRRAKRILKKLKRMGFDVQDHA